MKTVEPVRNALVGISVKKMESADMFTGCVKQPRPAVMLLLDAINMEDALLLMENVEQLVKAVAYFRDV